MAKTYNLRIDQGSKHSFVVAVQDSNGVARNLTGYTAKLHIKKSKADASTVLELTEASGLAINAAAGLITVTITDEQTTAMTWESGVYDLKITSAGGDAERILEGGVVVSEQVTV